MNARALFALGAMGLAVAGCTVAPSRMDLDVAAPRWELATIDGDTLRSDSLAGKVVVYAWIDPTCAEVQTAADGGALRILEKRWMGDDRVTILYVASMAAGGGDWLAPADWKPWIKEMRLRAPVLLDSSQTLARAWSVRRIPSAGIVDARGKVRWSGPVDALDSIGEPALSTAVGEALEGRNAWVPMLDPEGNCAVRYRK